MGSPRPDCSLDCAGLRRTYVRLHSTPLTCGELQSNGHMDIKRGARDLRRSSLFHLRTSSRIAEIWLGFQNLLIACPKPENLFLRHSPILISFSGPSFPLPPKTSRTRQGQDLPVNPPTRIHLVIGKSSRISYRNLDRYHLSLKVLVPTEPTNNPASSADYPAGRAVATS